MRKGIYNQREYTGFNLVKTSTKQTEESRKYHNFGICHVDISVYSILGFLLPLFYQLPFSSLFKHDFIL